jgi:mRNA interferase RelE/StbE
MSYEIRLARDAADYLQRVDQRTFQRFQERLDQIAADPYGPHTKRLAGPGRRRAARVGGWRIIFTVDTTARIVYVSDVGPRGQVYRGR